MTLGGRASRGVVAAALAALGCAHPPVAPAPDRAAGRTLAAPPPAAPASHSGAPERYGDEPSVALTPVESAALAALRARGGVRFRVSGALVLAARALARGAAAGATEPIGRAARRAALAEGAAYDPAPAAFLVSGRDDELPAALVEAVGAAAASHLGVGAAPVPGGHVLVLLAADRKVRLDPFRRDVAPGATATLSGTLERGLRHPRVFVTVPSGAVREVGATGAAAFRATIPFEGAGAYAVEVVAEGAGGPEVVALLAARAGNAPPSPPPVAARPAAPDTGDDASTEAAVVRALNALRARSGLAPLERSPEISAAARRHSERMREAGQVAHILPGSGELADRLRAASVPFRRAYENVARAGTALAAHEAAEESPAHRANMLQPDARRVGVGIARGTLPSGGPTVYLTEILVEPPDHAEDSPLRPPTRVREALWRERARLGQPPLTSDAALDGLATAAAEDLRARDATDAGDLGDRALRLHRRIAAVDVFVASAPEDAVRSANLRDGRFRRVGVGVASGDSRRFGAGRLFIAVVYTD